LFFLKGKRSENKVLAAVKLVIYQARREIATRFLPAVHGDNGLEMHKHILSPGLSHRRRVRRRSVYYSDGVLSRFATFCTPTAAAARSHHDPFELRDGALQTCFSHREGGRS
jgi:hypothetical protein